MVDISGSMVTLSRESGSVQVVAMATHPRVFAFGH